MKKFLFLIVFFVLTVTVYSQDAPSSFTFNVKGGLLMAGSEKVHIEDPGWDLDTKISPFFKADLDGILVPKLSMGIYILYTSIGIQDSDESGNVMSIGGTIKPRFTLANGMQVRPGIAIGYNTFKSDKFDETGKGLNIGGQLEISKKVNDKLNIVGEFGFISQPVGGIKDVTDITIEPLFYICLGVEFGK